MDQGVVDIPVTLVIKAPNQKYNDQKINCYQNWTVEKLKAHLSDVYPSKPSSKDQRLVYSGKLLLDHFTLKDVLRKHDEYHMLHLVCASRTPPASPKARSSRSNKTPQGPAGVPMAHQTSTNPSPSQSGPPQSSEGVRLRAHGPYYPMHPAFMHGYTWNQYSPHAAPPSSLTANPTYNNMTLMWWQQQYFHQYYMHYHAWAASVQQLGRDQAAARQSDASQPPPREYRHGDREAQADARGAGEAPNEDEENRDWLDWVYTMSRTAILISIVYFYSSFSRFVLVMGAILVLNLHQAGWFPFNLENDVHVAGDDVHVAGDGVHGDGVHVAADGVQQEDNVEDEPANADLHEREDAMDDALDEDEEDGGGEEAEEEAEDTDALHHANFLSTTWSFIITFFMSLIPEGPQNAAN